MNTTQLPFVDRVEAGRLLGANLATRKFPARTIVLALPRGGLPVGAGVADALKAPLDVVVVRKLGVPWQGELAMGAIAQGAIVLDPQLIHSLKISDVDLAPAIAREIKEAKRREKLYRGDRPPLNLRGRTVVIVDDGLATGSTMLAAIRAVRTMQPRRIVVAVPVGSLSACRRVRAEADECICLAIPEPFSAVGEWYVDFRQVTDDDAQEILSSAKLLTGAES
ncbi:MAG TPA: phosphoribosyltransferase [Bryobacteraceae bacterium]|nr:phosphoribosyltransferase [Bryobacteraceae bacterium]